MARSEPLKKNLDVEAVFQDRLTHVASDIETLLDRLLGPGTIEGELARPARLIDAMRYVALGGGKRFRPYLVVECATLFGVGLHENIVTASLMAVLRAANRALARGLLDDSMPAATGQKRIADSG